MLRNAKRFIYVTVAHNYDETMKKLRNIIGLLILTLVFGCKSDENSKTMVEEEEIKDIKEEK